ncbi:hypothetical protein RUM43_013552 [Polyplax serrata]|uniref:Secreted protein n=1 Tax=Polyplax serrata TaxID=468196 RepID=A0AAN8NY37_POLSC
MTMTMTMMMMMMMRVIKAKTIKIIKSDIKSREVKTTMRHRATVYEPNHNEYHIRNEFENSREKTMGYYPREEWTGTQGNEREITTSGEDETGGNEKRKWQRCQRRMISLVRCRQDELALRKKSKPYGTRQSDVDKFARKPSNDSVQTATSNV